jgi:hypothetical protein
MPFCLFSEKGEAVRMRIMCLHSHSFPLLQGKTSEIPVIPGAFYLALLKNMWYNLKELGKYRRCKNETR